MVSIVGGIQVVIGAAVDLVLRPFHQSSALWPLGLLAVLTGVAMLIVFRYTSNQAGIKQAKNRIKAHLLELRLFRDDFAILMAAQKQILWHNAVYMKHAVRPMLVMIVPLALLLVHLEYWFGSRPLQPGDTAIVTVRVAEPQNLALDRIALHADPGVMVETPALRIPEAGEVDWRIRADTYGSHTLQVEVAGRTVDKSVEVSDAFLRLSPRRVLANFWEILLYPGEPPVPRDAGLAYVEVQYPDRAIHLFGWQVHWLVVFFILSIVCSFGLKRFMRVEF